MKYFLFAIFLSIPFFSNGQIITNIAGGGIGGNGSPATSASVSEPASLMFDANGNLYFSELDNKIRKIDTAGIIHTIAGTGATGFSGDNGLATAATLHEPGGVAVDSVGNVFFADEQNNRIRRIDANTSIITTICGNNNAGFGGDSGLASAATLYLPIGLCFDKGGNLYIGDYGNHRIRKINTSGIITTYAGNGSVGWGGTGGPATAATISPSGNIYMDSVNNLYIAEETYGIIRKISSSGTITLVAGDTSSQIYNGDNIPSTDAYLNPYAVVLGDSMSLYVSDGYNNRIRKIDANGIIHTIAGTGVAGYTVNGGLADTTKIHGPGGITVDKCNNIYFAQIGHISKITFDSTCGSNSDTTNAVQNIKGGGFSVYPNPANLTLTLSINGEGTTVGEGINSVVLYNMVGQIVYDKTFVQQKKITIDISALPNGVYFVKVNPASGGTGVQKILKE